MAWAVLAFYGAYSLLGLRVLSPDLIAERSRLPSDADPADLALVEELRPDVLVKGADYAKEAVVGWDVVECYGGRIALAPLVDGQQSERRIQVVLHPGIERRGDTKLFERQPLGAIDPHPTVRELARRSTSSPCRP